MVTFYWILKYITFPGAMCKAFLEHLFCRIFKVPVEYNEYMQRNELCGHVEHLLADKKGSFGICFFPHILMLLMGIATILPASMGLFYLGIVRIDYIILFYIGLCFLMNCCPLYEDALNMWEHLYGYHNHSKKAAKIGLAIPAAVMRVGAWLEQYGLSLFTSVLFAYFLSFVVARILY